MLMPSAFSCDTSQPPLTRLQASLAAANAALAHAPPPLKLRLRSRAKQDGGVNSDHLPRKRIAKRAAPRGVNKRRRAADDDTDGDVESDLDISSRRQSFSEDQNHIDSQVPSSPSTPKRARIAPEVIPLGLERSDYHTLHLLNGGEGTNMKNTEEAQGSSVEVEADGEPWSAEEDRILVELVLEKLKLSKTEWQDCARSLGKDRNCLSRRWKNLMLQGDIGLKGRRSSRRTKLHGTW
ncbi:DNA-binding protein [Colletotrichum higginsianum]|nr:DNA-binding protein [Colletotrichum higginsianum]